MKRPVDPRHRPGANPELAEAMRGLANAAGTHGDRRTKRLRTRSARNRRAIQEGRE